MKAILFDLDGTLLPMNTEKFEKIYFDTLSEYFKDLMPKEEFIKKVWISIKKMLFNDGKEKNRLVFENEFKKNIDNLDYYMNRFNKYYESKFDLVKNSTIQEPNIKKIIEILKNKGYIIILATNPLFPLIAVEKRINWAGLEKKDFDYITHFDSSSYCKPNLFYYKEILNNMNLDPNNCYMVGNNVHEDMIASELGLKTFLVTPYVINNNNQNKYWDYEGNYDDLYSWANELNVV